MTWHVVKLADVAPTPWRNGGGVTRELAAWPPAGDWNWRMSVAEVAQSGPFSKFDGVERWFAVLAGAGVRLEVAGQAQTLGATDPPFCFDGAAATDCQLIDGSTQDFNLMLQKSRASARMLRLGQSYAGIVYAPKTIAIYAINTGASVLFNDEKLEIEPASLAWRSVNETAQVRVIAAQSLWMEITP